MEDLLRTAASGDIEAQRRIVQMALGTVKDGHCNPMLGYNSLLLLARIAASRGEIEDRVMLAGCLCGAANYMQQEGHERASVLLVAEAMVILEGAADEGSEIGADCLNQLIENLPPHVAAAAKMMKEAT